LDRGGNVFNRSAPIIQLVDEPSENDYLSLLGVLNSSTACYWMKQVFYPKASGVGDISSEKGRPEANRYEFAVTGMQSLPLPDPSALADSQVLPITKQIDEIVSRIATSRPETIIRHWHEMEDCRTDLKSSFYDAGSLDTHLRRRLVALHEELDWEVYKLFGLVQDGASTCVIQDPECELASDDRAFRRKEQRTPLEYEASMCDLIERRTEIAINDSFVKVLENPVFKRLWHGRQGVYGQATRTYAESVIDACRDWLLDRLESYFANQRGSGGELQTVRSLADAASADSSFLEVASIVKGRSDFDIAGVIEDVVQKEACPILPQLIFKQSGLRKRLLWEKCWELQRKQDFGEHAASIKPPPKYGQADFASSSYWRLRGKFDVAKERFISFPHCETESDPSLVVGWAGWNHLQQATAIIAYYDARKREGWDAKRLTPLLAGLDQLLPWIHQWHPEVDPEFGETAGQSFETMLKADAHELGLTLDEIRAWEPPKKTTTRRKRKTK